LITFLQTLKAMHKFFLQYEIDDVRYFDKFCDSCTSKDVYYSLIGRYNVNERQSRYDELREYFMCDNIIKFLVLFSELSFFNCGFGITDFDKINQCVHKSQMGVSGSYLWYIPKGDNVVKGSIEFVFYIDAKIRDTLKLQCKIEGNEVVPFRIVATKGQNDTYTLNGITDRLMTFMGHFPIVFEQVIKARDCGFYTK